MIQVFLRTSLTCKLNFLYLQYYPKKLALKHLVPTLKEPKTLYTPNDYTDTFLWPLASYKVCRTPFNQIRYKIPKTPSKPDNLTR